MAEISEEGKKLDSLVLPEDLNASKIGFPLFIDGNTFSSAGDGEMGCYAMTRLVLVVTSRISHDGVLPFE